MTPLLPPGGKSPAPLRGLGEPPLEWADVRQPSFLQHELPFYG